MMFLSFVQVCYAKIRRLREQPVSRCGLEYQILLASAHGTAMW